MVPWWGRWLGICVLCVVGGLVAMLLSTHKRPVVHTSSQLWQPKCVHSFSNIPLGQNCTHSRTTAIDYWEISKPSRATLWLAHVLNVLIFSFLLFIVCRNSPYVFMSIVTYLIGGPNIFYLIFVERNSYSKKVFRYLIFLYCQNWSSKLFFK